MRDVFESVEQFFDHNPVREACQRQFDEKYPDGRLVDGRRIVHIDAA